MWQVLKFKSRKVGNFWGLISTFVEVTGEKLVLEYCDKITQRAEKKSRSSRIIQATEFK